MPHLQELVKLHDAAKVQIVGINSYDQPADVTRGIEEHGVTWTVVVQDESAPICEQYRVAAFPTYIVLDAEGRIRAKPFGGTQVDGVIEELLAEMEAGSGQGGSEGSR
jgi:transcriptional regulator of NAD metabolism